MLTQCPQKKAHHHHWVLCAKAFVASPTFSPPAIRASLNSVRATSRATMVISIENPDDEIDHSVMIPRQNINHPMMMKRSLAEDLLILNKDSPNSQSSSKHVVVVMDAMKDFSNEALQWALDNVTDSGYTVTLLGVMPWLNLPLSCKTWLDVWTLDDLDDLPALMERNEWKSDLKYQKVRGIVELCAKYGVVPHMKVAMGYPLRLVVLEHTTSLSATWIVFDRHHRRNRAFYAKRIPCNVVMMNSEGEVDMIKVRPMIDNDDNNMPAESPAILPIVPEVIISDELKEMLRSKEQEIEEYYMGT